LRQPANWDRLDEPPECPGVTAPLPEGDVVHKVARVRPVCAAATAYVVTG
jgi:hypothetical protein